MQFRMEFLEDREKSVDDLKYHLAGYVRVYECQPEIAKRLQDDNLMESDLFYLRGFCSKIPGINTKEYVFERID